MLKKIMERLTGRPAKNKERVATLRPPAYRGRHAGRDFLVLASGPSLKKCRREIQAFIEERRPVVLAGNFIDGMFVPDYHAFVNRKRFFTYAHTVHSSSRVLLSPASQ